MAETAAAANFSGATQFTPQKKLLIHREYIQIRTRTFFLRRVLFKRNQNKGTTIKRCNCRNGLDLTGGVVTG